MNERTKYARRYHWLGEEVKDFVCEPHWAVCCDQRNGGLNLVALESEDTRKAMTELSHETPELLMKEGRKITELYLQAKRPIPGEKIRMERLEKAFIQIYDHAPKNFEELLGIQGVGPKTLQALSLISELIYGVQSSLKDPTRFSFAHGGKDGHPYPVDRKVYDRTIEILGRAIEKARVGDREKMDAIKRLKGFANIADFRSQIAD